MWREKIKRSSFLLVSVLAFVLVVTVAGNDRRSTIDSQRYIWWEGENAYDTNFPAKTSFSASTFAAKSGILSGGKWLSNEGKRSGGEAYAKYKVEVAASREYGLWARKFWKHGPFRWRFDNGQWQECGRDVALADSVEIRTHLCANWVYLGEVKLDAEEHTFELRLLAAEGEQLTACFDCFLLISGAFMPRGALKPGERSGKADPGYFPYEPELDSFSSRALLDLRGLNERTAGESGFVRRRGNDFVLGNGREVRFWAVNVSAENAAGDRASVDYLARKLAKLGVNMVRYHSALFDADAPDPARVDAKKLDDLHYLVAAMKKQGIYTYLSFYFPLWFHVKPGYGIKGYEEAEEKIPFTLLFHEPRMQEIHRSWLKAMLTSRNPYTNKPLAREPAAAIVEIQNEDSYFFWTLDKKRLPAVYWRRLEEMFGAWLAKRYGSLQKARAAWGGAAADGDGHGRAELFGAWHMTREGLAHADAARRKRISDQARFLAENQRGYYRATVDYIKQDLGYGGLVSAGNWSTADPAMLEAIEHYTYTVGDLLDRHGYFGGKHEGEGASYSVRVGHTWEDAAAVKAPAKLGPLHFFQLEGYPQTISEIGWPNPNRYRAEMVFLASAYGSLQGVDGIFLFAVGNNFLADQGMRKFQVGCPLVAGAFPAAALQYRRGDIREAEHAVRQVLGLEEMFSLERATGAGAEALDELRKSDGRSSIVDSRSGDQIDPLSFFVGKVSRTYGPGKSRYHDLGKHIDRKAKTIESLGGELYWDYARGLVRVNTWRSQGAAGFLKQAGRIDLSHLSIESGNEFGSLMIISLDGESLVDSGKILVQVLTEEQPYGFKARGGEIRDLGGAPMGVKKIDARLTLRLRQPGTCRVIALDENGYATERPVGMSAGSAGEIVVKLNEDSIYHVILR